MQTQNEPIKWAETLYTSINMGIPGIAAATGPEETFIAALAKENNWDNRRPAAFLAKQRELALLYKMIDEITLRSHAAAGDAAIKDAGLIKQYAAAIRDLESKDDCIKAIQVALPFTSWLLKKDLQFAKRVTLCLDEYIKELAKSDPEALAFFEKDMNRFH